MAKPRAALRNFKKGCSWFLSLSFVFTSSRPPASHPPSLTYIPLSPQPPVFTTPPTPTFLRTPRRQIAWSLRLRREFAEVRCGHMGTHSDGCRTARPFEIFSEISKRCTAPVRRKRVSRGETSGVRKRSGEKRPLGRRAVCRK